jgi:uncharacterized LabA/DUF88 family protein
MRVGYYTTIVGGTDKLTKLEADLRGVRWASSGNVTDGVLTPRVFKKSRKSQKASSVDINICVDVMRHCYRRDVEAIVIFSGDGDYVPLIEDAMRTGVRVYVAAFSSGCSPAMVIVPDMFISLDPHFFAA